LVARFVARVTFAAGSVVLVYYLVPVGLVDHVAVWVLLSLGLLLLVAVSAWWVHAVIESEQPTARAGDALASSIPLFLVVFALSYFAMSRAGPGRFSSEGLTRTDSLYFTVTVFSTVGFGDISPVSEGARALVTIQMVLDLVVLSLGVRVLTKAVNVGRARHAQPDLP
jgi:hypothetical protein